MQKRHDTMKNNHKPIARFIHRDRLRSPRLGGTQYYERTMLFVYLSRYFATEAICRVFSRYGLLVDLEYEQDGLYGIAFPFRITRHGNCSRCCTTPQPANRPASNRSAND